MSTVLLIILGWLVGVLTGWELRSLILERRERIGGGE